MKFLILKIIKLYQKTVSFDHGFFRYQNSLRGCKFYPSCSEFTYQAIDKNGVLIGVLLGFKRVLRCHPFSNGGYDPVPTRGQTLNPKL